MNKEEVLEQLYSLIEDRNSFINDNKGDCEIFKKDKIALEYIIKWFEQNELCLSGYRQSILNSKGNVNLIEETMLENNQLKSNWKALKEWLIDSYMLYIPMVADGSQMTKVLNKMNELDGSKQ